MTPTTRLTASLLLASFLVGCGTSATPARTGQAVQAAALTAEAATKDAQAAKLIASYQAVKGQTAAILKKRAELIDKIGETDSDRAATFLATELERVDEEGEASQDKLVPAVVSALAELDEDAGPVRSYTEGEAVMDQYGAEAKRKKRRFNVWDLIRKHFKKKKRKSSGGGAGGGGNVPPVPAPPAGA